MLRSRTARELPRVDDGSGAGGGSVRRASTAAKTNSATPTIPACASDDRGFGIDERAGQNEHA